MPSSIRIHRPDTNEAEIVAFVRGCGFRCERIGEPLDLLVGVRGNIELWEVKNGPCAKLRPRQAAFMQRWKGYRVRRIDSVEDAARALGVSGPVMQPSR